MRTYSTAAVTGAVLTTLLFAFSAFAAEHNALNGTWTLVPAKSDFAGQSVVQTGTVTIADREGIIITKTKWDRDVLKVTTTESGAVTLESYALAADGSMMVSVVRPAQKPITLVFQRK